MHGLRRLSIRQQLFLTCAVVSIVVTVVIGVLVGGSMRQGFTHYILNAELSRLNPIKMSLERSYDPVSRGWPEVEGNMVAWLSFQRDNLRKLKSRPGLEGGPPPPKGDPMALGPRIALQNARGEIVAGPEYSGRISQFSALKGPDGAPIGRLILYAPDLDVRRADSVYLSAQYRTLLFACGLALILSGAASLFLIGKIARPLETLSEHAYSLASGDFKVRVNMDRTDEFGRLFESFNQLAQNLEDMSLAEQRWVSNTSHELKTPLSILRAEVEAMQDGIRPRDDDNLENLHNAIIRLSDLVEDVNALALARENRLVANKQQTNLSDLVMVSARAAEGMIHSSGHKITTEIDRDVVMNCDARRIRQLINNLLENACQHTDAPGSIHLSLRGLGDIARLVIEDTAPGPPDDVMERLFDRFFRAESSRSRKTGGSGLGLSVAETIVRGHRGQIEATASSLGGLRLTVNLPLNA